MVTMREVAKHAGVSIATVSHVLNDTRPVSEELRDRVQTAMNQLGYKRNLLASGLRSGRTLTLGMIVGYSFNHFFFEVARGVEAASYENGYNVILCNAEVSYNLESSSHEITDQVILANSEGDRNKEYRYINVLIERQVDGLVLATAGIQAEHLDLLYAQQVPFVLVDREIPGAEADLIRSDHEAGAYQAVTHLIAQGHRAIACITGPEMVQNTIYRRRGYERALRDAGLSLDERLILQGDWTYGSAYERVSRLLADQQPVTAIFAFNDLMAVGAMNAITAQGGRVPEDIAIAGYDDIPLASYVTPSLTTVRQSMHTLGWAAAMRLFERIKDPDLPTETSIMQPELIVRKSSTLTESP